MRYVIPHSSLWIFFCVHRYNKPKLIQILFDQFTALPFTSLKLRRNGSQIVWLINDCFYFYLDSCLPMYFIVIASRQWSDVQWTSNWQVLFMSCCHQRYGSSSNNMSRKILPLCCRGMFMEVRIVHILSLQHTVTVVAMIFFFRWFDRLGSKARFWFCWRWNKGERWGSTFCFPPFLRAQYSRSHLPELIVHCPSRNLNSQMISSREEKKQACEE